MRETRWGLGALPVVLLASVAGAQAPATVRRANGLLDQALSSEKDALYRDAVMLLGVARRPDARGRLVGALAASDGHLRFAGAQGLRFLKDPASAPDVVKAWRQEKGWAVKKELSLAAGAVGARELVPDLKAALLYEREPEVRKALAFALEDLGAPEAPPALAELGNPERKGAIKEGADSWSRHVLTGAKEGDERLAVKTLAQVGTREDAALLEKALGAKDPEERLWAAAGILRLSAH